ncbi:hypothetical protein BHE74_00052054 [Ensete ventricosum]|nr:hypothetical protein BHE74_00052054 [Ensete ventricosum]
MNSVRRCEPVSQTLCLVFLSCDEALPRSSNAGTRHCLILPKLGRGAASFFQHCAYHQIPDIIPYQENLDTLVRTDTTNLDS